MMQYVMLTKDSHYYKRGDIGILQEDKMLFTEELCQYEVVICGSGTHVSVVQSDFMFLDDEDFTTHWNEMCDLEILKQKINETIDRARERWYNYIISKRKEENECT